MWDSSEEEEEAIDEDVGGEEYLHYDGYDGFDSFAEENDDDSEDDSDYEEESGDDACMPEAFLTLRDHVDFPLSRPPRFLTQGARPRRRRYEEAVIDCVDDEMTEYQGCDEFEVDDEFEVEIFMNNEVLEDGEIMSDTGAEMPENNEKLHPEEGEIVSDEVDSYDAEIFMNDEIKKGCIVESSYDSDKAKQRLAFDEDALMVYVAKYEKDILHAMSGPFLIHTTMDLGREKLSRIMGSRSELYHQSRLSALYNVKFIEHNIVPLMPMPNGYEQNIEESMRHLRIKGPFEPPSLYRKWAEFLALFQAIDTYQSKDLKWHMWMKSLFISAHYPNLREGYGWLKYCENLEGREQSPVTVLYNAYVWKAFKLPLTAKHVTRLIGVEELEGNEQVYLSYLEDSVGQFFVPLKDVLAYRHCDLDCTVLDELYQVQKIGATTSISGVEFRNNNHTDLGLESEEEVMPISRSMDLDTRLNEISNGIGIEKGEQVEVFIN
eukprot:jgi/Chrzof1/6822/UNPLg00891.t1